MSSSVKGLKSPFNIYPFSEKTSAWLIIVLEAISPVEGVFHIANPSSPEVNTLPSHGLPPVI